MEGSIFNIYCTGWPLLRATFIEPLMSWEMDFWDRSQK